MHSWNGKYRRPAGLVTPDYSEPMKGDLLWVYEGLTQYLGEILAPRTGLYTPEEFREELAMAGRGVWIGNRDANGGRWRTRRSPRSFFTTLATITRSIGAAWIITTKAR